ncbi:hypothetical protein FB567DRAFT_227476 [Paraphoma chrysanthemicola]|uniref:Uncharacterized protein n=1 Tax=Paraphoma chrysanthemicola TaxID=798071 RepID=A0A8K0RB14_9PLEO|nr:hypothetical protein FB567DRAFT_227476 [Paraphoma chrysanthemicola]
MIAWPGRRRQHVASGERRAGLSSNNSPRLRHSPSRSGPVSALPDPVAVDKCGQGGAKSLKLPRTLNARMAAELSSRRMPTENPSRPPHNSKYEQQYLAGGASSKASLAAITAHDVLERWSSTDFCQRMVLPTVASIGTRCETSCADTRLCVTAHDVVASTSLKHLSLLSACLLLFARLPAPGCGDRNLHAAIQDACRLGPRKPNPTSRPHPNQAEQRQRPHDARDTPARRGMICLSFHTVGTYI